MKTLIVSDIHLNEHFDKRKFQFLKKILSDADRVILNGDFWDGLETTFDKFINSKWKEELFPLLKSKGTIYIYGNHDLKNFSDNRVSIFSNEAAHNYEFSNNKNKFYIEHGHRLCPALDEKHPWLTKSKLMVKIFMRINSLHLKIWGVESKSYNKKKNTKMKEWGKKNLSKNTIYLCGHTHYPEIDLENRYVNSGFVEYGFINYIIVNDDTIKLNKERY